jgi:hypothetical protein
MAARRPIKHKATFEERLAEEARRFKEAANKLPPGTARELLLRRARQADTAHINMWLKSPGLQPPTSLEKLLPDYSETAANKKAALEAAVFIPMSSISFNGPSRCSSW